MHRWQVFYCEMSLGFKRGPDTASWVTVQGFRQAHVQEEPPPSRRPVDAVSATLMPLCRPVAHIPGRLHHHHLQADGLRSHHGARLASFNSMSFFSRAPTCIPPPQNMALEDRLTQIARRGAIWDLHPSWQLPCTVPLWTQA